MWCFYKLGEGVLEKIVQMRAAFTAYSKENHSPKATPALTPVVYTDASGIPVEFHIFPLSAYERYVLTP